jgi:hypothetical protein
MYTFLCNYILHLFLAVSVSYIIIFTGYGTRYAVSTRASLWPVGCECMQDGKAVTAWLSGPATIALGSSPGESKYFYSILLNLIINFVFIINIFYQICYLY